MVQAIRYRESAFRRLAAIYCFLQRKKAAKAVTAGAGVIELAPELCAMSNPRRLLLGGFDR